MKKFLFALFVCGIFFSVSAKAPAKKSPGIELDKSGCLTIAGELKFGGDGRTLRS